MGDYSRLIREAKKRERLARDQAYKSAKEVRLAKRTARSFPSRDQYVLAREARKARKQALASKSAVKEAQRAVRQARKELAQEREQEGVTFSPAPSPEEVRRRREDRKRQESAA